MKTISANGVEGFLLYVHGTSTFQFRVYHEDKSFTDYDIFHSDLCVKIDDKDAYFYQDKDGRNILDHSPDTLGL